MTVADKRKCALGVFRVIMSGRRLRVNQLCFSGTSHDVSSSLKEQPSSVY